MRPPTGCARAAAPQPTDATQRAQQPRPVTYDELVDLTKLSLTQANSPSHSTAGPWSGPTREDPEPGFRHIGRNQAIARNEQPSWGGHRAASTLAGHGPGGRADRADTAGMTRHDTAAPSILIAIAEVLADPDYGVEHSGDTTGGDALIILNGSAIDRLGFNCAVAALRDGVRANSSVGRFLRLFLRNVARSLPGGADKSTFGHTWRVVLAEHETAAAELDWPPFSVDRGFAAGADVVTVARFTAGGTVGSIFGSDPEEIARYLADGLVRQSSWELVFTVGFARGTYRPLLIVSPMVARTLRNAGVSKHDLRRMLYQHARLPAWKMERYIGLWSNLVPGRPTLRELVDAGTAAGADANGGGGGGAHPSTTRDDSSVGGGGETSRRALARG